MAKTKAVKKAKVKAAKTSKKVTRHSKRGENVERDAKIISLTQAGQSQRAVAKKFNLTPQRVNQIVAKAS